MKYINITEKIFGIEEKYNLFEIKLQNIYFWELIREYIITKILEQNVSYSTYSNYNIINIIISTLNTIIKIPIYRGKKEILIENNPDLIATENMGKIDIFFDYFDSYFKNKENFCYLDFKNFKYRKKSTRYANIFHIISTLISKFYKLKFNNKEKKILKELEKDLQREFKIKINLEDEVNKIIVKFKILSYLIEKLVKPFLFKKIIITVSYNIFNKALLNIAHKYKVPVIELQHGVISKYHMGYSLPSKNIKLKYAPDFLFTWGDYWNNVCIYSSNIKLISVGFPHFEYQKKQINLNQSYKNILVISQGTIGKQLLSKTIELAKQLPDFIFYYKIHPSENINSYKKEIKERNIQNIKIIGGEKNIYELFGICKTQIGVYSTALYEGLGFGLKTIVFDLPGVEYLDDLIEKGYVHKAQTIENIVNIFTRKQFKNNNINKKFFFKNNAINNIIKKLNSIR